MVCCVVQTEGFLILIAGLPVLSIGNPEGACVSWFNDRAFTLLLLPPLFFLSPD